MAMVMAILGLGFIIVMHELGHMLVARRFGMRVERFSVGFGPPLARWRGKKTIFQIALIPLGGFVQIAGMNPQERLPPDDPGSYTNKSSLARFATIAAGPLTNYLLAMILMTLVMLTWGLPRWQEPVMDVVEGSPAARGGLRPGDLIVAADGEAVASSSELTLRIRASEGRSLDLRVRRQGQVVPLRVTPAPDGETYRIGVAFGRQLSFTPLRLGGAFALGALYPYLESRKVLASFKALFTERGTWKQVGGVVEVVHQLKLSFQDSLAMALIFLAMLNVYLGLFNLFPIPALDGGRLVFLTVSMIIRRPINPLIENAVHTVGFVLLLGLILLLTYGDLARHLSAP